MKYIKFHSHPWTVKYEDLLVIAHCHWYISYIWCFWNWLHSSSSGKWVS